MIVRFSRHRRTDRRLATSHRFSSQVRRGFSYAGIWGFGAALCAAGIVVLTPDLAPTPALSPMAQPSVVARTHFSFCEQSYGANCVIDGDTFRLAGRKIRIADIDTPEIFSPKCSSEKALGLRAKDRLQTLLNQGPFTVSRIERDKDKYGRDLRTIERNGRSLGASLISEGLARAWTGSAKPWC